MNKIMLIGHLGKDPEITDVGNTKVCKFTLATTERYKNKSGEKVEDTTWHSIEAWGNVGEILAKYLSKGDKVYLEGQQRNEKGEERYYSKVRVSAFEFLGSKSEVKTAEPIDDGDGMGDDDFPY
jgi:single-strand DNA-binding protein